MVEKRDEEAKQLAELVDERDAYEAAHRALAPLAFGTDDSQVCGVRHGAIDNDRQQTLLFLVHNQRFGRRERRTALLAHALAP